MVARREQNLLIIREAVGPNDVVRGAASTRLKLLEQPYRLPSSNNRPYDCAL